MASAALDVRRRADHRSELTSQLLMGETVRVTGATRDGQWWKVVNDDDGYRGWVRCWGLIGGAPRRVARWRALARGRIVAPLARATTRPGAGASVAPLHWNSRVIPRGRRGAWRRVELPSGLRGWIQARALASGRGARIGIQERAQALLGTPYLWGGRTALGIDCSGLTQQMLAEQGIRVPRDAARQYRASRRRRPGEAPQAGDLVFFADGAGRPAHVGLMLGGSLFVQSRGVVRLSSLDPVNPMYDNGLDGTFMSIRRPGDLPPDRPGHRPRRRPESA